METTLTQRDKALLLILGIIIIIFAAVMIPNYGIYALITNRSEATKNINKQKSENETLYFELVKSGISGAYVESGAMARSYLSKLLLEEKHDSAKLSTAISRAKSFDTAKAWLYTTKYQGFVLGEDTYFESVDISPSNVSIGGSITMYDLTCSVNQIEAKLEVGVSSENVFTFDLDYCSNSDNLQDLASMIVMASQLSRKGSCFVQVFSYDKSTYEEVSRDEFDIVVIVITSTNEDLTNYASQICECHNCGHAYYYSDYVKQLNDLTISEGDSAVILCPECQEELDGTTIG